jgi:mono/diheme cytochrome c family protein
MFVGVGLAALTTFPAAARAQQDRPSGAEVWAANCGRCHRMRATNAYSASQWDAIVTQMSLYARLTPDESQAVRQFLAGGARAREDAANAAAAVTSAEPRVRQIAYLSRGPVNGGLLSKPARDCKKTPTGPKTAASIYKVQCSMCHGPTGKGDGPVAAMHKPRPSSFTDAERMAKVSDDSLAKVISVGRNEMPSFKKILTENEIREVVTYVRCFSTP